MFHITKHPNFSQFIIKRKGSGVLPAELSDMYTSVPDAQIAINRYEKKRDFLEAEALARKEKQKEVDKKPLSDAQRKKRNAKKPSTSRK